MGAPATGKKIGNYRICEQIGGGAMGRVWRGIDEALGRPVAIKMLRTELADRPELIERFRVEARALARLSHPNIASVYALLEHEGELYLVMEYLRGQTLHAVLERRGPLAPRECFPLFHRALDGIQHAHESGVVHRDIKASNLMFDHRGQVKWIDFGIARMDGRTGSTRTGGLLGTPEYMAPEQVRGEAGTVRSDVYSLGVLLYKLLTGRSPFAGGAEYEMMRAHVEDPPPRPSELGAPLDEAVEAVLMRTLEKDPEARFASARELQQALAGAGVPLPAGDALLPEAGDLEPTLCDGVVPPPEPTRPLLDAEDTGGAGAPGLAPTVPGFDPSPFRAVDPEAPTRLDAEGRAAYTRLVGLLCGAVLLVGAVLAVNWIVASRTPEPAGAGANAQDPPAAHAAPGDAGPGPAPPEAPPADTEPRAPGPAREPGAPPRSGSGSGSGWKIVR